MVIGVGQASLLKPFPTPRHRAPPLTLPLARQASKSTHRRRHIQPFSRRDQAARRHAPRHPRPREGMGETQDADLASPATPEVAARGIARPHAGTGGHRHVCACAASHGGCVVLMDTRLQEYKDRCKQWGIPRRIPRETTKYITHRIEKRKREKKQSAVIVAGIRWTDQRIKKEACRNFYTTQELVTNRA